jgi:hypothetical protein
VPTGYCVRPSSFWIFPSQQAILWVELEQTGSSWGCVHISSCHQCIPGAKHIEWVEGSGWPLDRSGREASVQSGNENDPGLPNFLQCSNSWNLTRCYYLIHKGKKIPGTRTTLCSLLWQPREVRSHPAVVRQRARCGVSTSELSEHGFNLIAENTDFQDEYKALEMWHMFHRLRFTTCKWGKHRIHPSDCNMPCWGCSSWFSHLLACSFINLMNTIWSRCSLASSELSAADRGSGLSPKSPQAVGDIGRCVNDDNIAKGVLLGNCITWHRD